MAAPADSIWQDREIRFDSYCGGASCLLDLRRGEKEIDTINSIEDTKGNNGDRGQLTVTNLRIIWQSHKRASTNLSIGLSCVQSISVKTAQSRLRGQTQALYVMTKFNNARFEFIFTSLVKASPRMFQVVQAVARAYETSRLYRDLKLRGALIKDDQLIVLPHEQIFSKVDGVWNLSSDQGNLGTFFITNVRLVWHAHLAQNFNVSMPYQQMKSIRVRDSKFGSALVIETTARSGGYVLGFRVDPAERLADVMKEITSLHRVFSVNPIFGVDFVVEERPEALEAVKVKRVADDVEIVQSDEGDAFAAYCADATRDPDRPPVFSEELGLAVETPREGFDLARLWAVL